MQTLKQLHETVKSYFRETPKHFYEDVKSFVTFPELGFRSTERNRLYCVTIPVVQYMDYYYQKSSENRCILALLTVHLNRKGS